VSEDLTRPERYTELAQAREHRRAVKVAKGCAVCAFRAGSFHGQGWCRMASMTFPRCVEQGGTVTYTPDFGALRRLERAA
jgi:hypothetical protein